MGNIRSAKRKLNEKNVWIAKEVQIKKREIAKEFIKKRVQNDVEFAKEVLAIAGNDLSQDIRESAEKTISDNK